MDAVVILLWVHIALAFLVFYDSFINYRLMSKVLLKEREIPWSFFFYMVWSLLQLTHGLCRVFILGVTGSSTATTIHLVFMTLGTLIQWLASMNMKKILRA